MTKGIDLYGSVLESSKQINMQSMSCLNWLGLSASFYKSLSFDFDWNFIFWNDRFAYWINPWILGSRVKVWQIKVIAVIGYDNWV